MAILSCAGNSISSEELQLDQHQYVSYRYLLSVEDTATAPTPLAATKMTMALPTKVASTGQRSVPD